MDHKLNIVIFEPNQKRYSSHPNHSFWYYNRMHEAHDLGKTGHGYVLSHLSYKDTMNCLQNMSFNLTMPTLLLDLESFFNLLQSCIGWEASWPMRDIETFPSKQIYLYLAFVKRAAEFYRIIDRRRSLVCLNWLIFVIIWWELMVSLPAVLFLLSFWHLLGNSNTNIKMSKTRTIDKGN